MVSFLAIAFYNVLELSMTTFMTFKRHRGLYYWSLQAATWGIAIYALGFVLKYFQVITLDMLSIALVVFGWYLMVTGQSIVLYSRLSLVVQNRRKIRWVLIMIIANAIISHIPTSVFAFGANSRNPKPFISLYSLYEKIQITLFFVQETIISSLYVFETIKILRPPDNIIGIRARKVLTHLIYVNIMIILMDITLLGTEYSGHYEIQTTYKAALYSVKLKMEFYILNQLVAISQANREVSCSYSNNSVTLETWNRGIHPKRRTRTSFDPNVHAYTDPSQQAEGRNDTISIVRMTQVMAEQTNTESCDTDRKGNEEDLAVINDKPKPVWTKTKSGRSSLSLSEMQFAEAGFSFRER
jgi:hypothetical protein